MAEVGQEESRKENGKKVSIRKRYYFTPQGVEEVEVSEEEKKRGEEER